MDEIAPPVTEEKVRTLAEQWADKPKSVSRVEHRGFNGDKHMGGYAFWCDRGLLIYGRDGGSRRWRSPSSDADRFAKVEQFWREGRDRAREFRDDDAGYLTWLKDFPDGFVLNIVRSHSPTGARLHRAHCRYVNDSGQPREWTKYYVKICAKQIADLELWATANELELEALQGCTCPPVPVAADPPSTTLTHPVVEPPTSEGRWEIHGPLEGRPAVEAWADDYVHFQNLPAWQKQLRDEIRSRCRQLKPTEREVLHATFFGAKRLNADVENLVLYNIDPFAVAGRNGIRIEFGGPDAPPAPDGAKYLFGYRYELASRSEDSVYWRQVRTLASFDWTDLEGKTLAHVWLALARRRAWGEVNAGQVLAAGAMFAVNVELRPPSGLQVQVNSNLVKTIFDGVICAFQTHTDPGDLSAVVEWLAELLQVDPEEIERLLRDQDAEDEDRGGDVIGAVQRLIWPRMGGVQWNPSDDRCVAGELLPAAPEPGGRSWAIRGEILEINFGAGDS